MSLFSCFAVKDESSDDVCANVVVVGHNKSQNLIHATRPLLPWG
jgi:hypothetical protein